MKCKDSEGWYLISTERPYDVSLCFHEGVFATVVLCILLALATASCLLTCAYPVQKLTPKSALLLHVKLVVLAFATGISCLNLILIFKGNNWVAFPGLYILEPLSVLSIVLLTFFNHTRRRRSSTTLLIFWPMYTIVLCFWTRALINKFALDELITVLALRWSVVGLGLVAFILEFWSPNSRTMDTGGDNALNNPLHTDHPTLTANIYSLWFFSWLTPLMRQGASSYISEDDLPPLLPSDKTSPLTRKLEDALQRHVLWKALLIAYGPSFALALGVGFLSYCVRFLQPQLLRWLLSFISEYRSASVTSSALHFDRVGNTSSFKGFVLAGLMFFASVAVIILSHQQQQMALETGMRVRAGLTAVLYQKALVLSNDENEWSSGAIVNMMSVDVARLERLCEWIPMGVYIPVQVILAFVLLYDLLGWPCSIGIGIMVLATALSSFFAKALQRMERSLMQTRDARINLTKELLNMIKSIKFYAWEYTFLSRLLEVRNNQEMKMLRKLNLFVTLNSILWVAAPLLVGLTSLATAAAVSNEPLTPDIIFPSLTLFIMLKYPSVVFSQFLTKFIEGLVSLRRVQAFLDAKELSPEARKVLSDGDIQASDPVLQINHADFSWSSTDASPSLENITMEVKSGQLVGILGQVGSGKSSLLNAILGEMTKRDGKVMVRGTVSYAAQNAWIQSASIRDNILFGHVYEEDFYSLVIDACALKHDLNILPQGDMTLVGEKGTTLSGGQRARLALARAVYARADLILLDDCLAAVDNHVAKHIFENVIGPHGLLASKARILATNSVAFVQDFDRLIYLRRGIILEQGSYADLLNLPDGRVRQVVGERGIGSVSSSRPAVSSIASSSAPASSSFLPTLDSVSPKPSSGRSSSHQLTRARLADISGTRMPVKADLREEHAEKGRVQGSVYIKYIKACSTGPFVFSILATFAWQACIITSDFVIRAWTNHNYVIGSNEGFVWYLSVYAALCVAGAILSTIGLFLMWAVSGLRSAKLLHDEMVKTLLRAPVTYFETTPMGRILNLLSQDLDVVDQTLSRWLTNSIRTSSLLCGTLVVIATGFPLVLIAVIPLAWFYIHVVEYFLRTSRELKRLEAITKSPIFSWFSESMNGLSTIRAFGLQRIFTLHLQTRIDRNQVVYLSGIYTRRWLAIRLELIGSVIVLIAAMLAVFILVTSGIDSGLAGLVLTYAITTTNQLNVLVSSVTAVEQSMVSVERIIYETDSVHPEAPQEIPDAQPSEDWPCKGAVELRNYSTRYRPELDLALKDISVTFAPGEKVGIVGRTGSGKSTLLQSLFRIVEPVSGTVLIDDVDISKIGLHDLRSRLSIVPQFPDLFEGTLRENIDPLGVHPDADIWSSLEHVYLKDLVESLPSKLDAPVKEGGTSLSAGQRQLLCFARALLRKSKVLVLDEATSSIDLETDQKIQQIVRGEAFREVTILTIAHRLDTIMDSDRVLVMESGRVAEFDTPEKLLQDKESLFFSLAESSKHTVRKTE